MRSTEVREHSWAHGLRCPSLKRTHWSSRNLPYNIKTSVISASLVESSLSLMKSGCRHFAIRNACVTGIYLWRKVVCLFCTDEIHRTRMLSDRILGLFGMESSLRGGVHGLWFHGVRTCSAKVLEYWMVSSLKIKLNRNWKCWRNWNVLLMLLQRSWWAGF